jgi:putative Ca2+/H+ antiporter (TMEM165/GDT1 family)
MRTALIFVTGFVLGILLTEMISIYGFLLYNQTVSLKVVPFLIGIVLAGIDLLLRRKSKLPNYKSSLH